MAIIFIEGLSAVGKTTTSYEIARRCNAYVVDEVPPLFQVPDNLAGEELNAWLMERALDRWRIAQEQADEFDLVILDGDHIKIWYDWIYGPEGDSWKRCHKYLREKIEEGSLGLPDGYFLLSASEDKLRTRKLSDSTRSRRNFEKHLKLIEPQKRFFESLNVLLPGYVSTIESLEPQRTAGEIPNGVSRLPKMDRHSLEIIDEMGNWLCKNLP